MARLRTDQPGPGPDRDPAEQASVPAPGRLVDEQPQAGAVCHGPAQGPAASAAPLAAIGPQFYPFYPSCRKRLAVAGNFCGWCGAALLGNLFSARVIRARGPVPPGAGSQGEDAELICWQLQGCGSHVEAVLKVPLTAQLSTPGEGRQITCSPQNATSNAQPEKE